jgi:low affinity Fe/Cu permease
MWLDRLSAFIARYKGLPTMLAVLLVVVNFVLQFLNLGWLSESNLLLHLGIVVGLIGLLLAEALG